MMITNDDVKSVFTYLYAAECGIGDFYIVSEIKNHSKLVFIFWDWDGKYNVFRTMEEYTLYVEGSPCERIIVGHEYADNFEDENEEGVSVIDLWLYKNIRNIDKAFEDNNDESGH
jgi:hypothetical protein